MTYFSYKKLNVFTVTLLTVVFGVLIAAAAVDWYSYEIVYSYSTGSTSTGTVVGASTLNFTKFFYGFEGQTQQVRFENKRISNTFTSYSDLGTTSVEDTFQLAQAFTLIGLLLAGIMAFVHILYFFDAVRNKVMFWVGMTGLRVLLILTIALIAISEIIAFLGFLGITEGFKSDNASCNAGPCTKFSDSVKTAAGTTTVDGASVSVTVTTTWGAVAGWYLVLASIPVTIVALIVVTLNKFPLPVDSEASGEAL
jgi:hypothetical protein